MKPISLFRFFVMLACLIAPAARLTFAQSNAATFGEVINNIGGTPSDVVLDELRGRLYLVNDRANRVDVYSIPDKRIVSSIGTGITPLAAAMSMDGSTLFVTNSGSATLSVIDLGSLHVNQTVGLGAKPEGVEVGLDGRALVSTLGTGGTPPANTLLIFDPTQQAGQQLTAVQTPPPPTTPSPLPAVTLARPDTTFHSKLIRTPDGQYIVGLTNPSATQTYLFVYEVASGVILRSRTVTGQSTVLTIAPDGSRFMAGFTLYDTATLAVIGQMSNADAPFPFTANFNVRQNIGGSVFSPDGTTIYGAFNVAAFSLPQPRPNSSTLLISDSQNLGIKLGIRLPEGVIAKTVITADGSNAWSVSESGLIHLPLSTLYQYPILQPETTTVFLAVDECNRGLATGTLRVNNAGNGKLTYNVQTTSAALVSELSSGLAPSAIKFTLEPGRAGVNRQAGTNLATGSATLQGTPLDVTLSSPDAINIPNTIRVYMNYRNPDQRGIVYPLPTSPNSSANTALPGGNEALQDIVLDEPRGRVYITNSGFNRIEVFDINRKKFVDPIVVGQLPHQMAMATDGTTLYVGNTGGESIGIVDLNQGAVIGNVAFPPLPRQGGGNNANPIFPRTLAAGLFGLEFIMSNGSQWKLAGNQATIRPADTVTKTGTTNLIPAPQSMLASPDGVSIITLAGNGQGYLYDAASDAYIAGRLLFNTPIQSYYGPLGAAPGGTYFLAGGLVLNPTLTVVAGSERPGVSQFGSPAQRHVAAVFPLDLNHYLRLTVPVKANITSTPADDPRPNLEQVNIQSGEISLLAVAAEQPRYTIFGTTRLNVPTRSMVVDSQNTAYVLTLSGLTVIPLTPSGAARPQISTAANAVVNATDGSQNIMPGSFITVTGTGLAASAAADTLPAPTVLGGSCVTFNDIALPLYQTSDGQIQAQVPANVVPGSNVVQVRSLALAQASDPVIVTVGSNASQ
ncbi:MAG: hypothetical protein ACR2I2_15745 [Bryobacteraceae bacterium]